MTQEVRSPLWFPTLPEDEGLYIARPMLVTQCGAYVQAVNHILGQQLNLLHQNVFGSTESDNATYRFLTESSPNVDALLFSIMPWGNTDSGAPFEGTIAVPGADITPVTVSQRAVDVADLGDVMGGYMFVVPIGAPSFTEFTYTVTDLRLHAVEVWEVPRTVIDESGALFNLLDRTYADPDDVVSDNGTAADPRGRKRRGHFALGEAVGFGRTQMRRHLTPFVAPGVTMTNPALNTWVPVPGFDNLNFRGRLVKGHATLGSMAVRGFIYVSARTGGTWEFRLVGNNTSAVSATFNTTGWKPGSAALTDGVLWEVDAADDDLFQLEVRRTVADGNLTINGVDIIEEPVVT